MQYFLTSVQSLIMGLVKHDKGDKKVQAPHTAIYIDTDDDVLMTSHDLRQRQRQRYIQERNRNYDFVDYYLTRFARLQKLELGRDREEADMMLLLLLALYDQHKTTPCLSA